MAKQSHNHAQWSSRTAFVLAATGSAVGLGNIWKFPYMVGESGGAVFVVVYLACIALIGLPILVSEWLLGRRGQSNPINTMETLSRESGRSPNWVLVGIAGVLGAFLILSFYSVVGGWSLNYTWSTLTGDLGRSSGVAVGDYFEALLKQPWTLFIWHTLFMLLTFGIVAGGVKGGLERAAKWLMPLLIVALVGLIGFGTTTTGFDEAAAFMFSPDWSKLNGGVVLAALGHAFFTLSLGMGIMMAYGSYLGQDVDLIKTARTVVILDTLIALAAGMAIFPVVFANGQDAGSGPGLIFSTLPTAFMEMPAGTIFGTIFFALLTIAALTSAISLLEPVTEFLEERTSLPRIGAALVAALATWALGIAALLSFNLWSGFTPFGLSIFNLLDALTAKFMLPLTGLAAIVFTAWFLDSDGVKQELGLGSTGRVVWHYVSRYVAPIGVVVVFFTSL
ncbi:sodium-dependent transporter [Salinicola avicenniae]|uniref:sodium-dependent transporter n=1 Tax=Salinicola avicenniae TaxID=2916836 RepID=UPI00207492E0|nr:MULTISPECIES: sodium-dependent transporter [unclassified Salinicola]